ncbi:non-ribosomal peptide synthetase [Micromonospora sp. NPDC047465]|uniref:non-ribosomal peptide synthetase n=1 Tax=Micromonospora sp. NPDC047465 TaxID=3154813 RepID=UPI0033F51702
MRSGDSGSAAPVPVSDGSTYRYTATRPAVTGPHPAADVGGAADGSRDRVSTAALAAVELLDRLGRQTPVRVRAGAEMLDLPVWPADLHRMPGDRARATVRACAAALDHEGVDHVLVLLDEGSPAPSAGAPPVLLTADVTDTAVAVVLRCAADDPWSADAAAVAEMYAELLAALLADPASPTSTAPALGPAFRALVERAGRRHDDGPFVAVPRMIEHRVDLHPQRRAVSFRGRSLTYRELDDLANGVAAVLAARGIGRGDVVPVLLADGLELPVVDLALMKLGAAFVPVDPGWPADRLRASLAVIRPRLVVVRRGDPRPGTGDVPCLPVGLDDITPTRRRPGVPVGPGDLIYGIFTSGTTGAPKCAVNRHDGIANRFRFMTRYFAATGAEVVLQNSRHTFDSSVWQMFWPLTTGGRVVVPVEGGFLDVERTVRTIADEAVTMTDFVPSVLGALVSVLDRDPAARRAVATLRHVIVGGEEIDPWTVHRLADLVPGVSATNGYGPTEASIGMVFHTVTRSDGDVIPIGRPIDNCYAAVVDAELRPLPPGATGEIVIGGVCLGEGYLGDPARTAEVFVPNPLPGIPGTRLYRTGDLGRLAADGRLHFVGRRDFQLKVNGVRIEAGEIETAATRHTGVRQAKVLLAREGRGKSLALFVAADPEVTEPALRAHLRRLLPRPHVPRHVVVRDALPLTGNGKVDRRALETWLDRTLAERARAAAARAEARTLPDRVLAVFRTVLGRPDLDPDTDFLDAGGDSLQALDVVTALGADHHVRVGVQDLFAHPTAARLARVVAARLRAADPAETEAELVERDAAVPADLPVRPVARRRSPRTVLVTGATGFVGARLVHELLATTDVRVLCLARAADDAEATARVVRALAERGLWRPGHGLRLHGYAADLARPALGLDPETWGRLAHDCDLVLHAGALVNFLFDYRAHRQANVLGTAELLRLALTGRPKPLHHVSTLGVLDTEAARRPDPLPEGCDPALVVPPTSGYSRSKWVAERYLAEARRRGATVTVLRLGEVMPAADDGQPNPRALTHLLLAACHRLRMRPDAPVRSDWTPVDWAARRIVATVVDPRLWGGTMHVLHPVSVDFTDLPLAGADALPRVSCVRFVAALREAATDGDRAAAVLLALFPAGAGADEERLRAVFATLLTDNPRLFRRDGCAELERRRGFTDHRLGPSVGAYRAWLGEHERRATDRLLLPAGPG